jgi:hypothetical protein
VTTHHRTSFPRPAAAPSPAAAASADPAAPAAARDTGSPDAASAAPRQGATCTEPGPVRPGPSPLTSPLNGRRAGAPRTLARRRAVPIGPFAIPVLPAPAEPGPGAGSLAVPSPLTPAPGRPVAVSRLPVGPFAVPVPPVPSERTAAVPPAVRAGAAATRPHVPVLAVRRQRRDAPVARALAVRCGGAR